MKDTLSYEEMFPPAPDKLSYEDVFGAEPPKPSGILRRGIGDKLVGFASGAVGATKAIADAAGADNAVSQQLGLWGKDVDSFLSPEAKADQAEQSRIMAEAKGKDWVEGIKAGGRAFLQAPIQTTAQGLGSIVPVVAGSIAGAPGMLATGVAMGTGTAKGAIFDEVKKRNLEAGRSEAEATALAQRAQEYSGENTDQIALGGTLGAADALTGVSRIAGGMVRGALNPVKQVATDAVQHGLMRRAAMGALEEVPLEAAQGGQEQVAANIAAQRAGFDVGTWDGVASKAALEGMAALIPGAGFGAIGGARARSETTDTTEQPPQQSQTSPTTPLTTPLNVQTVTPGTTPAMPGTPPANAGPISQAAAVAAGAGSAVGQTTIPPTFPQNGVGGIPHEGVDPNSTPQAPQQSGDESYAKNRAIMDDIPAGWNKTQQEHPASTVTPQAPDQQPAAPDGAPSPVTPTATAVTPTATAVTPAATAVTPTTGKLSDAATIAVNNGAHGIEKAKIAQQQAEEAKKQGASTASGLPQFTAKAQPTTLGQSPTTVSAGPGFGIKDVSKQAQAPTAQEQPPAQPAQNSEQFIKQLKEQINGLEVGDSLVNDMGDSFAVETVIRNKQGDVTGIVTPPVEGGKRGTLDVDQIASILTSQPYTDVNTGERKMSAPGSIQKAKPATATTQNAPNAAQTVAQGPGATQPTQDGAAPDAAAWQGMTPEQRRRSVLEQTIATGTENNGGVMVKLRPSAIEDRKQQLAAMGDAGKMTDAQPTATPNVEKTGTNQQALDRIASGKAWFGNELKAKNWVHTNGLADTHEVQMTAPRRFEVVLKKQPQEQINANQDQQTQSQVSQDPLLSKLATGYGYPGGVDTMPAGLGTTARKLHSAITSADVAKAQEILRPENKRSREAFEHLFDGRVKLPNTVKGTNDTVADFLGKVSAAQRQAGVAVTEESSVPESGSKPENENVAFIKALNDARKELPPGFEIQPQRRSDGTPTVSLMENGKNAIDGLSRTEAGVQEALQHAKLRHTERQAQVSDKASLLQELRTKLSALGQRALDAGDGAMSVRISGFTVGMKDTDANLTRKWVDEVVAEREQAVSKLEAKAKKELDSQKPLSVPQKLRAQKDLASTQSAPTDDAATAAGFTHLAKDHQWSKTVVVGENRRELFNIREFGPVGDRSYRVSKSTTFPGTVVTGAPSVDIGTFKSLDDAVNATGQKPTTSQPVTTAAPVSVPQKLRAKAAQAEQARADYFTPGNIVSGYGQGHDRVISYTPPNEKGEGWSVTVQSVVKENGQWVNDPMAPRQRTHATMPDSRELAKGPVERAEVEDKPAEIQNAPADQSKPLSVPEKLQAKREANDIREQSLENAQNNADTEIKKEAENDPAKQGSTPTLNHPLDEGQQPAGSQSPARGARQARAGEGRRDDGGVRRGRQPDNLGGESGQEGINDGSVHTGSKHGETGGMAGDSGRHASDFIPSNGGLTREGSWFDTAKRNIDLIELAIKIESENRAATPEEQAQLSKYVGFGAGAIRNELFPVPPEYAKRQEPNRLIWPNYVRNARFKPLAERIEALPREWQQSILQSSQYAHYTSEGIIRSVWSGLQRMGFTGGNVFEPGMGIGSFAMLMPNTVRKTSRYTGVEFDAPTALIARLLSPQQNMLHGDFIKRKFPKNFFDVNVGNPPFSQTKIFGDPEYAKHGFMLHDFFFAKGIDLVRPGGIQVFVTSKGTMDKQNDKARKYLAERADLLGAVRLPSTAFEDNAGTSVVTDVIFLRKRAPGEEPAGHAWGSVATVETKDGPVVVNEYFAAHPEMVLGQQRISGNMDDMGRRINSNGMGGEKYTVVSYDSTPAELDAKFAKAIENLPENAYSVMSQSPDAIKDETAKIDFDPSIKREGVVYLGPDGTLMRVENGVGKPLADTLKLSAKDAAWFKSYVGLRDLVQEARFAQVNDGNWETSLKKLNKAYDAFRKQHGPIKDYRTITRKSTDEDGNVVEAQTRIFKNQSLWREDYDSSLITALETISEDGNIVKAPFLLGRTIGKPVTRDVRTIGDALAVSLDSTGKLNLDDVANRMHLGKDEVIDALGNQIYQTPDGEWQLADEYLSGNVVQKLDEAEEAARLKPELRRNVEALKQVQPEKLGPSQISAKLGASWIPVDHVNEFSKEIDAGNVTFDPKTETWQVEGGNLRSQRKASAEYGTTDRSPSELLETILNSRPIKITGKTADGKTVVNNEATTAANEAAKKIKDKFKGWVWTDTNRASELVEIYNKRYNNIAPRKFDGSHLTLPGVSLRYKLHPHQLRAIWRIIQTGNTYLAHAVGAGKTIEMIAAGMEQKRLGLIKKPIYTVPNHMLEQFSNEFMDLYPLANIMVADDQNFSADKRKAFIASATLNNPDAIIITHDAFQRIGVKEESIAPIRDEILTDLELELSSMAKDQGARVRRSQLEQQIEAVKQRFDRILGAGGKDATIKFEDMGVDFVFVDEAHAMRKLDFQTSQQIKGIDPNGSKRALDMYIKTRILDKKNPGRSMVFASGTPVTNTMGELYTIMRFFAAHQMDVDGISTFDAWSRQFGEVAPALEPNAAGKYEMVERFAKFDNVPELMSRVRQFMDVLTSDNLGALIKRPDLVGGKPNMNIISMSQSLKSYMQNVLAPRIEVSKKWKPTRDEPFNTDPILKIISDGRFAAIDPRFFGGALQEGETSIINEMGDKITANYHATKDNVYLDKDGKPEPVKGSTQIVFYNNGYGASAKENRGFDARAALTKRLTAGGIPRNEIAWFDDADTDAKKEAIFKDMRSGKLKVLIGSAKKMGTGVNVQKRLAVLHYQDPPWYPADVEQPHGRIIRQGNQNPEVKIEWYTTKGTYQSTMWQMVGRKQRFIDQAFTGDKNLRSMEDMGEASLFEQAAAVASGDPRAIQLAGLRQDVERFERLQAAHASEQINIRSSLRSHEWSVQALNNRINTLSKAFNAIGGRFFSFADTHGKVNGVVYSKPGEFGQAIKDAFNKVAADSVMDGGKRIIDKQIARLGDAVTVTMDSSLDRHDKADGSFYLMVNVGETSLQVGHSVALGADVDASGLARRVFNQINSIDSDLQKARRELVDAETEITKLRKKSGAPFEYQQEMVEKHAELKRLEEELRAEGEAIQNQPTNVAINADGDIVADGPVQQSRSRTTQNPTTVQSLQSAIRQTLGVFLGNGLGRVVATTSSEVQSTWGPLIGKADIASKNVAATAQAFYDPDTKTIFLLADRIEAGTEQAVLVHELMHKHGRAVLGQEGWDKLHAAIESWKDAKAGSQERQVYDAAAKRVAAAGAALSKEELFPYAVEEAIKLGIKPNILAPQGTVAKWLAQVKQLLRQVWDKLVRRPDTFNAQDMVNMAFGIAQRENAPGFGLDTSISWDSERLDRLMSQYAYPSNDKKTKAFAAWVSPQDFLAATTPQGYAAVLEGEAKDLDAQELKRQVQEIYLEGKIGHGKFVVTGHEGRHRMVALARAGVKRVPVVFYTEGSATENATKIDELRATPQKWAETSAERGFRVENLTPISWAYFDELSSEFASNADIRYSRATFAATANKAASTLSSFLSHPGTVSGWWKTVGSMYGLAQKYPEFKPVFDAGQRFLNDVSFYATEAATLAPTLLPKLESIRDIFRTAIPHKDNKPLADALFQGTLSWKRDAAGKLEQTDKVDEAGVIFSDDELKSTFGMNDRQVGLYREARAAIDNSLDNTAKAAMVQLGGKEMAYMRDMVMGAPSAGEAAHLLTQELVLMGSADPTQSARFAATATDIQEVASRINQLKKRGYAPLSRFGRYTVSVRNGTKQEYFGLFESKREANTMADKMRGLHPGMDVKQGTLSQKEFEQYQGITPETAELFGEMLGLDQAGPLAKEAFQEYLRMVKNNRSALKRLIHRKGIAGYNEDVGRVLSAFIASNARKGASDLHLGDMSLAVSSIPQDMGELKDIAIGLQKYLVQPQEEAPAMRGMLFAQYIGGSVASAMVNLTQPMQVSMPYLSQFGGAKKATAALAGAYRDMATKGYKYAPQLDAALKIAEEEGIVAPQEIHQLQAQARGAATLRSGDGTPVGELLAMSRNGFTRLMLGWGKMFGLAEQVNRRATFIAAFRMAQEQGITDPAKFASKAVNETQFVNNKGNRMMFGRGAIGSVAMTFKSYGLNYLELLHRLATQDGTDGKYAAALMIGMLMLMAGAGGLPFEDDLHDLIDAIAQRMGYNISSNRAKQKFLEETFGKAAADFIDKGITGLPGVPIDMSLRMGMGNMIPGTGLLLQKRDHTRDVLELAGPAGDFGKRLMEGFSKLADGKVGGAILDVAPRAVSSAAQGVGMLNKGYYSDTHGRKVIDTTTGEGLAKIVGFQPQSVAADSEKTGFIQRMKDTRAINSGNFAEMWAKGIYEGDPQQVQDAQAAIRDWNEKNPDTRITPNIPAILRRVREMRKTRDQRMIDSSPKAMRAQVRRELMGS